MIRKEIRIINGREAHLYYDEERQAYLVASDLMEVFLGLYENANKLANQLVEKIKGKDTNVPSNNGWIPCSERLPDKEVDVLVCFSNDMDCVIAYRTKMMNANLNDVWVNSSTAYIISSDVIAWQPLPAPYQPKEDKQK